MQKKTTINRRGILKAGAAFAGFQILPSGLWANSPNSRLCSAHIGVNGKGKTDTAKIAAHPKTELVALCDVDRKFLEGENGSQKYPGAELFQDYREMLAKLGDKVDIVSISTPDHTHYPATMAAMELGKHVYTQKPLTNNIAEARGLMEAARRNKVITQMGIQNQSTLGYRMATSFIRDGLIGKIGKVHVWSHKDWGHDGAPYPGEDPVPDALDWDLWLGTAPSRPYLAGKYHDKQWRRICDYGSGTLGDMGIHIFDTPFRSLGLKPPVWAVSDCREPNGFSLPTKSTVTFGFEPTELTTEDFEWVWHDGTNIPANSHPDFMIPGLEKLPKQGALFIGEEGRMLLEHISGPRFYPNSIRESLKKPDIEPKVDHYNQWIDIILGKEGTPTANFDYAAPLTESVLLGAVAGRFPGQKLEWDSGAIKVTNIEEANQFVTMKHREF